MRSTQFSFIIPVYNGEATLAATLESVLSQSQRPLEIIVVDNGSTDKTKKIAKQYKKIKYIYLKKKSRALARNKGAALAKGDYLLFLDADVRLASDWVETVARYLKKIPVDALATKIIPFSEGSNALDLYREEFARYKSKNTFLSIITPQGPFPLVNTAACVFAKKSFDAVGGFDVSLIRHEDLELSLRLFRRGYVVGGVSEANASVRFTAENFFLNSRELSYLWRAFEVQYLAFAHNSSRWQINWNFLHSLWESKQKPTVISYAALVELARCLGKNCQSVFGQKPASRPRSSLGKNTLAYSFHHKNKLFLLKRGCNFIFVDHKVYSASLANPMAKHKLLKSREGEAIRKLCAGIAISQRDSGALLKLGLFWSPTEAQAA